MKDHAIAAPSYRDELVDDTESLVNQGKNNIVTQTILAQCSIFIPPENIRYLKV